MTQSEKIVTVDANILLRAVFGTRVRILLRAYAGSVSFCAPDVCFADARRHLPQIAAVRQVDPAAGYAVLAELSEHVQIVDRRFYETFETQARERLAHRDESDWPILACSLLLNSPVWTEDQDLFGVGVPTCMTATIEIYLRDVPAS